MAQEKHGWDDQEKRDRDQNENPDNEENGGQNALRNSANDTEDEDTNNDNTTNEGTNSTEGLNQREDETEPLNQDEDESGQGNTTGQDYGTRQADSVGEGGPGRNSDQQDTQQNRKDLSDRGEDEGKGDKDEDTENEE